MSGEGGGGDLWIFAYGSLMWRPGFPHAEARRARLTGYRRCFCVYSMHHRGTEDRPGMVLGLDRGGDCEGMAFRVPAAEAGRVRRYLAERELVYGVYREALLPVMLEAPYERVTALCYIVERAHPSYAGRLPIRRQARLIRAAQGLSGSNIDYLINTLRQLRQMAIKAPDLERLLVHAGPLAASAATAGAVHPRCRALMRASRAVPPMGPRLRPDQRRRFMHRFRVSWAPSQKGHVARP